MSNVAAGKDTDDDGEKLNDVEKALNKLGIKTRDAQKEWRNFEDIIDEVAGKWKKFADTEQSQIATAIAGTRQQEIFRSLMNNYDMVGDLAEVAAESTGSATEKMNIYLDSVEAKTNELKATWEQFVMSLGQSEGYKSFLDLCIWMLNNIPILIQYGQSILGLVVAFQSKNIINGIVGIKDSLKSLITSIGGLIGIFTQHTTLIKKDTIAKIENLLANQQLDAHQRKYLITLTLVANGVKKESAEIMADTIIKTGNITATKGLATASSMLSTALSVVMIAFSAISMAIANYNKHLSDLSSQVEESSRKVEALQDNIDKTSSALGELSTIESEYQQQLINNEERMTRLKTVEDELNSIYEDKIGKIDLINKGYREQIGLVQQLNDSALQEQLAEAQKGEAARKELLDRNVTTFIGHKDDLEKNLSNEVLVKIGEIAGNNNLTNGQNIYGANFLQGKAKDLKKFTNALEEYRKELIAVGKTEKAQEVSNFLETGNYFPFKGLKEETETTGNALEEQEKAEYLEFRVQNSSAFNNYQNALTQKKNLIEEFNKKTQETEELQQQRELATTEKEKKTYDIRIKNAQESKNKYYDLLTENANEVQTAKEKLFGLTNNENYLKQMREQFSELENVIAFKTDNIHIDKLKEKYNELYNSLKTLDDAFEKGQISAKQYFDGINQEIGKIDTTNLDDMKTKIESLFGNNLSYLDTFMGQLFSDTITDAQDVENLRAYTSNMSKLIQLLKDGNAEGGAFAGKINDTIFSGDGMSESVRNAAIEEKERELKAKNNEIEKLKIEKNNLSTKEYTTTGKINSNIELPSRGTYKGGEVTKVEVKGGNYSGDWHELKSSDFGYGLYADKIKSGGEKQYKEDVERLDKAITQAEEDQKNLNKTISDIKDAGEGLDTYQSKLEEVGKVLEDMNISDTQNAFDTLAKGFEDGVLDNVVTTLDKIPEKYRNAFIEVADDIAIALGSSNEAVRAQGEESLKALIGTEADMMLQTVDFANLTEEQMNQVATNIANKAIIAQGGVSNALQQFATEGNKIASTAMGQAVQTLGMMLDDVGKALAKIDVKIPVKIPNIKVNIAEALLGNKPLVSMEGTSDSEISIGGQGTVANGFKELGQVLQNADYADAFAKLQGDGNGNGKFNPYSFNPTGKKDKDTGKKKSGSGSKNNYSAEDAASDLKDILNDIEKYEEDIELDLEDQTEQFINQEMLAANRLDTLREELDYYNDIYDVTENTSKWLETQNKLLDNQSKKVGALQNANASIDAQRKKLIKQNSKYNVESWFDSEGNDTLEYGNLINSFEYKKEAIERDTAAKMRAVYNRVSGSKDKDTIKDAKDEIKRIEEEADIKIKAIDKEREKVEKVHDSVGELNDAWKDNQEAIREALKELHDLVKSMRDELLDDITEQLEKAVDRTNKSLEKSVTRMEQLVTIQEKSNDILNETIDTQQELDSELQASLDSFEYLDEQMRELMFNEDDYKVLSETLTGIQNDVASIWEDHYKQIDELTDDTMYKAEYITAETERQLDMKMREYELAKAELDVAKARTNLQNVKNERNVRMFVGGQWIWTADPNAVKDAQQQLADAEREKNRIEREAEQQRLLDKMNKMIDSDNLQIDENNELLERIQEAIEEQTTEVKSIEDALANASGQDLPALNDVLQGAFGKDGGDFKEIMTNLNKGQTALAAALDGKTTEQAEAQLKRNDMSKSEFEALVKKLGYGWDEKTGTVTTWDGSFKAHYKGWKDTSKPNTPLGTGSNGASVTGGGANGGSSGGNIGGGGGNNSGGFPKNGRVSTSSLPLRIRSGAGTNYKVLGSMPKGASVTITGEGGNGWAKVSYKGINGYASKQYLTYDQGGLAMGKGMFLKDVQVPERVLSPQQTKSFDKLVNNLTTNPVLAALTKNVKGTSSISGLTGGIGETKQYYFSNFTVKADNLTEFIDSLEGMIPITNK